MIDLSDFEAVEILTDLTRNLTDLTDLTENLTFEQWGYIALFVYLVYRWAKYLITTTKVIRVVDGDTVRLKGYDKNSRLHGIDAPESGQLFGDIATRYLKRKVEGKRVKVVKAGKCKWGRDLVKLYRIGSDINRKMVKKGHAIPYMSKDYERDARKVKFSNPSKFRNKGK